MQKVARVKEPRKGEEITATESVRATRHYSLFVMYTNTDIFLRDQNL